MRCRRPTLFALIPIMVLMMTSATALAGQGVEFTVMRNGNPIGHHRVEVTRSAEETRVDVDIALDVSFGFITLYHYRHQATERWKDDRLLALDSITDDNGTPLTVHARADAAGITVSGQDGTAVVPRDTVPTSYWNPALVTNRPLLDSQTGRLLDVTRQSVSDTHWRLIGDLNLEIVYDGDGQWDGLWFRHRGSDFVYVRNPLPQSDQSAAGHLAPEKRS